jgi:hypothetical protein
MKWMGGWSWREYLSCPQPVLESIVSIMQEEVHRAETDRAKSRRRR